MRLIPFSVACALALGLLGCPAPAQPCLTGEEDSCDAGTLPPDGCNSKAEAETNAQCQVTLGTELTAYITTLSDGGTDQDWYLATMPATLTARSLLHVSAGYPASVPQTAVNFSVNVLEDGTTSLVTGTDKHGAAAPRPVDLVLPYAKAGAKLFLLVGDEGGTLTPRVDNRNAYRVLVEVLPNPDGNEPNDTTPTPVTLAASGGLQEGTQSGYLATNDDVDEFSFPVTGTARQIIYLHLTSGAPLTPPTPYRLAYTLFDPSHQPIAEGHMANEFLQVDLSTAKVAPTAGTYTLAVQGYRATSQVGPVKGDLRLKYDLTVRVMPDLDVNEPNDTLAQARPKTMSLGGTQTVKGRLSSIPDEEWYSLELPANAQETVLRYRFSAGAGGGRFAPTALVPTRQLRLVNEVTAGATAQDRQVACKSNAAVCPKSFEGNVGQQALVEALCSLTDPPQCLWAERNEDALCGNQKNMAGSIPVAAHAGTVRYALMFRDVGLGLAKYADDVEYTLEFSWEAEPAHGPTPATLGAGTTEVAGELAYGHGRAIDLDVNRCQGIRGPNDYDAVATDLDTYQFNLPSAVDQAWSISWDLVPPTLNGATPGELFLEFVFCDNSSGSCRTVKRMMAYSSSNLTPWYLPTSLANATVLFRRSSSGGTTTITAEPVGCWCVAKTYAAAGSFSVNVGAVDRTGHEPLKYRLRQSLGAYPSTYAADGGTAACPASVDAGCGFGL